MSMTDVVAVAVRGGLMTSGQAAKRLDLSSQWVRRLAREGRLPYIATVGGRYWMFRAEDVEALALARAARPRGRNGR